MTYDEAIDSLIKSCNDYAKIVEQLQEENAFLTDTIEKNNLGRIISERRSLLSENERYKRNADIAIREAGQLKLEYESKISEAEERLADAKRKQSDIDLFIEAEAEKKITGIKLEYEERKKANDNVLKKLKSENNAALQEEKDKIYSKIKKLFIITTISIVFNIISLSIHFL